MKQINFCREKSSDPIKQGKMLTQSHLSDSSLIGSSLIHPHVISSVREISSHPFNMNIKSGLASETDCHQKLLSPHQGDDCKTVNASNISKLIAELGRALNIYCQMEKDEHLLALSMTNWYHEIETIFLPHFNNLPHHRDVEALIEAGQQIKDKQFQYPSRDKKPFPFTKSFLHAFTLNKEIQRLKLEVETHRKNSASAMKQIDQIMEMMEVMRNKYEAQKEQKKILTQAITAYSDETDHILSQINEKHEKDQKMTLLEVKIQQELAALQFETFPLINHQ